MGYSVEDHCRGLHSTELGEQHPQVIAAGGQWQIADIDVHFSSP
jgi:hypothetical protein